MWTDEHGKQFADVADFARWGHAFGVGSAQRILSLKANPLIPAQVELVAAFRNDAIAKTMQAACEFAASQMDASESERRAYVQAAEAGLRDQLSNPNAEVILKLTVKQ